MAIQRNPVHYYQDGDCEIVAEGVAFRIHKNIIALSSSVFRDLFTTVQATPEDMSDPASGRSVPRVPMSNESAANIEMLLSFLYPNTFFEISWDDVEVLLRLSDKYIIDTLFCACVAFLKRNFHEYPVKALTLADRYRIPDVYKESSKLVLDSFEHLLYDRRSCEGISRITELRLKARRQEYVDGLNKLFGVTIERQFPPLSADHLRSKFEECIKDLCAFPLPPPSETWSKLREVDCSRHFQCREELRRSKPFITEKIVQMFGQFEPLKWNNSRTGGDPLWYPFIELNE